MKKAVNPFIFIACLTLFSNVFGQTSVWKIEKNDNIVYLGGTIHLLTEKDYPLPAEFDSAYAWSESLVFETDIAGLENPSVAQQLISEAMYTDETTLKTILEEEVYENLVSECESTGLNVANMIKFKPSVVILTLTITKLKQMDISADGVDLHFFKKSDKDKKKTLFLESIEEQITLMTTMGDGNENAFVKYSLEDFNIMENYFHELVTGWRDGSADMMKEEIKKMHKKFPDLYQSLLVNRNNAWMPQIESYFNTKSVEFILVGALHIHGKHGILTQLKNKGYTIEQVEL